MNLGSIRTHFKALLNRSDITDALADTFLDQGTVRIQRQLRIPSMEKQTNYNLSSATSTILLPNDFLESISLYYDGHQLNRVPQREILERQKAGEQGQPHYFSRVGGSLLLSPVPATGTITLDYYANFPAMTQDSDENILAQVASDLIIYSALTYAADYFIDERLELFEVKYQAFLAEVQQQADDAELSGTMQVVQPAYQL